MKARRPLALRPRRKSSSHPLVVERCEERILMATFTVTTNADTGVGSLRDAITSANGNGQVDKIVFNLQASELTIRPQTALPVLSESGTTIDGTSQTGYAPGAPVVEISGQDLPVNTVGLTLTGGNITINSLLIDRFGGAGGNGISISGQGGDTIIGNFIGNNGTTALANGGDGIFVNAVGRNTIGGNTVATRNVISGNGADGISLFAAGANGNSISGNYIGLNAAGTAKLGNVANGITINSGTGNIIGGIVPGTGNVISGNSSGVVVLGGGPQGTLVQGNFIGTDATGTQNRGNTFDGLTFLNSGGNTIGGLGSARNVISANGGRGVILQGALSTLNLVQNNAIGTDTSGNIALGNKQEGIWNFGGNNNFIGGLSTGLGNIIANNGSLNNNDGVYINGGSGNQITSNSIHDNVGLGIHLSNGSNNSIGFPTISKAETAAGFTNVAGSFTGAANSDYVVQFFSSPTADPSGFGEGKTLLQPSPTATGITVTTNGSGVGTFKTRLLVGTNIGDFLTATLTRVQIGDTSQFSRAIPITQAPQTDLQVSIAATTIPLLIGTNIDYSVVVTNRGPDNSTGSTLTVTLDPTLTLVNVSVPYTAVGNVITINVGALATAASRTFTITTSPTTTGKVTNQATIAANEIDPGTPNNSATTVNTVLPAADLGLTVIAPANSPAGANLTYILSGTNAGPSVATNVKVDFTLDPTTTFVSATLSVPGTISPVANGVFTATIASLPVGSGGNFTLIVVVTPNVVGPTQALAAIRSDIADPIDNNHITANVTITPAADLSVAVTSSPAVILVGAPFTYSVTVHNAGPSAATGVILTSVLDASLTSVTSSLGTYDTPSHTLTANLPTIPANSDFVVTITATPTISKSITNSSMVHNTVEPDTNGSNDSVQVVNPVSPIDLALTGSVSANPATIGQLLTFNYTVTNNGPSPATNVVFTNTLPNGVTLVSTAPTAGVTVTGNIITISLGSLAAGASVPVSIVVRPTVSGPISTVASVTATETDTNPANNTLTLTDTVSPADLGVAIVSSTATAFLNDQVTYTIVATNNGPSTATNVSLADSISGSFQVISTKATQGSPSTSGTGVNLVVGSLASGASVTLTIVIQSSVAGKVLSTATVTGSEFDPTPGNNSATNTVSYVNSPGLLQFASPNFSVQENGGVATVTVSRTKGTLGAVSINYTTVGQTAVAGVNFAQTSGTLNFADGQTTATFTIPIFVDGQITPNLTLGIALSGATGGAVLGNQSSAILTIINTDRDLISPTVQSIQPILTGKSITAFLVGFSKALDPTSAGLSTNYSLFVSGRDNGTGIDTRIPVASALYNPVTHQVAIIPAFALPENLFYKVVVNGNAPNGVMDIHGNLLDGQNSGGTATSFIGYAADGNNLSYVDGSGNLVALKLTGGGYLTITRGASGDAALIQLNGVVGHARQVLSGSVKRTHLGGNGVTSVGALAGIGAFGDVFVKLTTPPFYVSNVTGFKLQSVSGSLAKMLVHSKAVASPAVPVGPKMKLAKR